MQLRGIGYVGLRVPDPAAWAPFAEPLLGLMPATSPQGASASDGAETRFYRLDDRSWRIAVHRSEVGGLAYLGWELPDERSLDAAVESVGRSGVAVEAGSEALRAARGVSGLARLVDPWGHEHELYYGAPTDLDVPFVSPAGISGFLTENGLGHVLIVVPDARDAEDYYTRVLDLRVTDRMEMGGGKRTIFLRTGVRHHALAVTDVLPEPGFHHVMLETRQLADVGRAWDRVQASGRPIMMTLGQHANDPMVSFYVESPGGFGIELGFGGTLIDEASWVVREVGSNELWGHHGVAMDEIRQGAEGGPAEAAGAARGNSP